MRQDERAFAPGFLERCTDLELVALQHDLRRCGEDRPYLDQVLAEFKRRATLPKPGTTGDAVAKG